MAADTAEQVVDTAAEQVVDMPAEQVLAEQAVDKIVARSRFPAEPPEELQAALRTTRKK